MKKSIDNNESRPKIVINLDSDVETNSNEKVLDKSLQISKTDSIESILKNNTLSTKSDIVPIEGSNDKTNDEYINIPINNLFSGIDLYEKDNNKYILLGKFIRKKLYVDNNHTISVKCVKGISRRMYYHNNIYAKKVEYEQLCDNRKAKKKKYEGGYNRKNKRARITYDNDSFSYESLNYVSFDDNKKKNNKKNDKKNHKKNDDKREDGDDIVLAEEISDTFE